MRRRIEITVYRRSTVLYGQPEKGPDNWPTVENEHSKQIGARSSEGGAFDKAEAQLSKVDISRLPELALLIEALMKGDATATRAHRHPGLSFSNFISKLRGLKSLIRMTSIFL